MKNTLLTFMLLCAAPLPALCENGPSQDDFLTQACLTKINKLIAPAAVALTGDRAANVSDQGQPLQERGTTATGAKIFYKPLWKVVGSVDGYYHLNAGAYLTFTGKSCRVIGIELKPDSF